MATLGQAATPSSGSWFDVTGNKQFWSGTYTFPAGGGLVTQLSVYCGGNGSSTTGQLVIWGSGGSILWQSGNLTIPGSNGWVRASVPSVFFSAGTNILIGFWASGHVSWIFEGSGGVSGKSGQASPGTATGGSDEYSGQGFGALGGYVDYTPITAPSVASATPNVGTSGTSVAVAGSGFTGTTSVTIGGASASFTVTSDTSITATVPAGAAPGAGSLVVTNPDGSDSVPFTVGTIYGDNGLAWQAGVLAFGDSSAGWPAGTTVWADNGTSWVQIG